MRIPARPRRAALVAAAGFIAASTAIANAEPPSFLQQLVGQCVSRELSNYQGETWAEAREKCCTDVGGTYNIGKDECYLPDNTTSGPPPGRAPLPGATVILPPGVDTTSVQ